MAEITAAMVKQLREASGCGIFEAKTALVKCDGDMDLAEGFLRYNGLAINVRPQPGQTRDEAYSAWVWARAVSYAEHLRAERAAKVLENQ